MAQAIMDPDEVRRFAAELKRFNAETRDEGYVEVNSPQLTH